VSSIHSPSERRTQRERSLEQERRRNISREAPDSCAEVGRPPLPIVVAKSTPLRRAWSSEIHHVALPVMDRSRRWISSIR
jgi:hypothetical protein